MDSPHHPDEEKTQGDGQNQATDEPDQCRADLFEGSVARGHASFDPGALQSLCDHHEHQGASDDSKNEIRGSQSEALHAFGDEISHVRQVECEASGEETQSEEQEENRALGKTSKNQKRREERAPEGGDDQNGSSPTNPGGDQAEDRRTDRTGEKQQGEKSIRLLEGDIKTRPQERPTPETAECTDDREEQTAVHRREPEPWLRQRGRDGISGATPSVRTLRIGGIDGTIGTISNERPAENAENHRGDAEYGTGTETAETKVERRKQQRHQKTTDEREGFGETEHERETSCGKPSNRDERGRGEGRRTADTEKDARARRGGKGSRECEPEHAQKRDRHRERQHQSWTMAIEQPADGHLTDQVRHEVPRGQNPERLGIKTEISLERWDHRGGLDLDRELQKKAAGRDEPGGPTSEDDVHEAGRYPSASSV